MYPRSSKPARESYQPLGLRIHPENRGSGYILTTNQSYVGSAGIFSQRTNQRLHDLRGHELSGVVTAEPCGQPRDDPGGGISQCGLQMAFGESGARFSEKVSSLAVGVLSLLITWVEGPLQYSTSRYSYSTGRRTLTVVLLSHRLEVLRPHCLLSFATA